jgi:transposase
MSNQRRNRSQRLREENDHEQRTSPTERSATASWVQCEGHLFLFTNARRNRLKLVVYDGSGLWVCSKRLDKGCFRWPDADSTVKKILLSHEELALLLGGIDLKQTSRRAWHRKVREAESDKLRITA